MHYLNLKDLPSPPPGKKGWPWTKESASLPPIMPDGREWPKISIVTPSFNQGQYIEETIRSVLLQNYPNFEYIIIDGGSTDNSVEIIKKYEPWLTYWISEQDRGQSHAINKGFERCTGDIYNWLCSDDILIKNLFFDLAKNIKIDDFFWIIGNSFLLSESSKKIRKLKPLEKFGIINLLQWGDLAIHQPSVFWNRKIHQVGFLINENLNYCMDIDLWLKYYIITDPFISNKYYSYSRRHKKAKTTSFSSTYNDYLIEFTKWRVENIYRSNEIRVKNEIENSVLMINKELNAWMRIKNHVIFGKMLKIWKLLLNKKLPI